MKLTRPEIDWGYAFDGLNPLLRSLSRYREEFAVTHFWLTFIGVSDLLPDALFGNSWYAKKNK
jgi:hypothetical protein